MTYQYVVNDDTCCVFSRWLVNITRIPLSRLRKIAARDNRSEKIHRRCVMSTFRMQNMIRSDDLSIIPNVHIIVNLNFIIVIYIYRRIIIYDRVLCAVLQFDQCSGLCGYQTLATGKTYKFNQKIYATSSRWNNFFFSDKIWKKTFYEYYCSRRIPESV